MLLHLRQNVQAHRPTEAMGVQHTGRWSFEQAVKYFMEAGGLDREAAEGEAAGAASNPSQKISYITGKWQIMRLLGRYRDGQGAGLREFVGAGALVVEGGECSTRSDACGCGHVSGLGSISP